MDMTPTVLRILSLALGPIVLQLIFCSVDKKNGMELIKNLRAEHVVLRYPKAFIWIGVAGVLGLGGLFVIAVFQDGTKNWEYVGCLIFIFIYTCYTWYTLMWKIECFRSKEFFIYRPFWGKGRKVFYRDVEYYRFETGGIKIKTKTGKLSVEQHVTNMEILLAMLTKHGVPEKK